MSWILVTSISIRLLAVAWSLVLLRRLGNWRMGLFTAFFVLATLRPALALLAEGAPAGEVPRSEIASLVLSVLMLAGLLLLGRIIQERDAAEALRAVHEQALKVSEAKLATAFRASPDAIVFSSLPEGVILEINEGFSKLTGYHRAEVLGRTSREIGIWAHPEERQQLIELLRQQGRVQGMEWSFRGKTGEVRHCMVSAEVVELEGKPALLSLLRDISERKRSEQALEASEAKFATAFRSSPDAILITSIPEGEIVDVNDSFSRIAGYGREEVLRRTTRDLGIWVSREDRDRMQATLQREGRVRDLQTRVRNRSGEMRTCVISGEIVEIEDRPHLLTVVRDITEQQRAEEERSAFVRELEAKNAELERFTYTVSHDLKSPLVTIRGFLGLLEKDIAAGDAGRVKKDVERIFAASETMRRLLDDLLELSRIGRQVNPPQEIDSAELIREALELVGGSIAERGVEVEVEPFSGVLFGDRPRLLEVLQNLLENAVRFMGDQAVPRLTVGERSRDGETVLFVRDNGIGIDPRYHEKIFGLFDRLDPGVEGTGIGLALVKRIVEVHGGRVWVESAGVAGEGSTFCLTLPGRQEQALEAEPLTELRS